MGTFLNRVRTGKVASPTTPKWSAVAWQAAFDAAPGHDDQDRALLTAGNWCAAMLASHRARAPELGSFGLTHDELIRAAIAGANRNWIIANEQLRIPGKPGDIVVSEHLMSRRLTLQPWNIEVDPEGLIEATVDSIRHIVFSSGDPAEKRASVGEILDALLYRSIVSSAYLMVEGLWKDCLWNSWAVFESPEVDIVRPTELRQALAEAVAGFRSQTLRFSQYMMIDQTWRQTGPEIRDALSNYRIVREVRGTGRDVQITTRRHGDDEVPDSYRLQMMGNGPWLDHLIREELPKIPSVTPELLFQAWDYLRSLADVSTKLMPKDTTVRELNKLWCYAPAFPAAVLAKSVTSALRVSPSVASVVLDLLTMQSLKDADPWLTPLWKVKDRFFLVAPVALTSNPRRLLEHWLTQGGVDLSIRGPLFEAYVRSECVDGIAHSRLLVDVAHCAHDGIELDHAVGDMDLVLAVGSTVLIGEIKCTASPGSAVDRANYYAILHEAAEQVLRKLAHAANNVDALSKATGWTLSTPTFLGVIVTDQEIGVGQLIKGVPVVDHTILTKYFQDPQLEHGVTLSKDGTKTVTETTKFYRTAGEAERNLETYLLSPPQLRMGLRFVHTTETPLLTTEGERPAVQRDFAVSVPSTLQRPT